jgi:VanZ family protein
VIRLTIWLPPLVWMAAIMWFSSGHFSADETAGLLGPLFAWLLPDADAAQLATVHGIVRKAAHVGEYALLALLWFVALRGGARWRPGAAALTALVVAVAWAAVDELHQSTQPSRTASVADVGFDAAGALLAAVVSGIGWRRTGAAATTLLLWLAAAGGAALIAINLATGVGSGALWVTVPLAVIVLLRRRRRAAARRV